MEKTMEKIVALAKARGFVYPGSEIYGGLANTWDYGNLGVELKNNVKRAWWQKFVQESPYNVGVHPKKAKKDNKTAARLSGNNLAALPYILYLLT